MKVIEEYQNSNLFNSDVKWYLFDEQLWIRNCAKINLLFW